jgi:starch phosphorylase
MHPDLVEYGNVSFHGDPNALYDRRLVFDYAIVPALATTRERYEAIARSLRDVLALRWLKTKKRTIVWTPSALTISRWSS